MNALYKAHRLASSTGQALSGSRIALWMDKVLSAGARKRADELLKARAAYIKAKAAYDAADGRGDCRGKGELFRPLKAAHIALLRAEGGMGVRR
jgi:hypothetical protein